MSNKAETVTCENCRGKGNVLIHNGVNWNCLKCSGTGVRTTGAVVLPPAVGIGGYVYAPDHNSGATVTDDRDATIAALTTERDVLRLEVQRLKDLSHESQDLYAAIEAERDELRAKLDAQAAISWERDARLWRSKAESYLRVIDGMQEAYSASLTMLFARIKAGLPPLPVTLSRDVANAGLELPEEPDHA